MRLIFIIVNFIIVILLFSTKVNGDVFPVRFNCIEDEQCICDRPEKLDTFIIQKVLDFIESEKNIDEQFLACCYHQVGNEYYMRNKVIKAIKYNKLAHDKRLTDNNDLLWKSKVNLGMLYYEIQELKKSTEYLQNSLYTAGLKKSRDSILIYRNLADSYGRLGELDKALDFGNKAIQVNAENWRKGKAFCVLAQVLNETRDSTNIKKAIKYAGEALKLSRGAQDYDNVFISLINKGNSYQYLRKYKKAISQYEKAIGYADSLAYQKESRIAHAINNISTVLFIEHNYPLAIERIKQSLDLQVQHYETEFSFKTIHKKTKNSSLKIRKDYIKIK